MKAKICAILAATAVGTATLAGCAAKVDYTDYISEKRSEIYLYEDDDVKLKICCVAREQPYNADGICGDMCDLTEVTAVYTNTPQKVFVSFAGYSGEMNYEAVGAKFTVTFSAPPISSDGVDVKLEADGNEKSVRALGVLDKGVISCEQAVNYAAEYDRELFESLTQGKTFAGEIYVRLLFDDGCYYYVGVCDRNKNITAYLLDGGVGKVITTRKG